MSFRRLGSLPVSLTAAALFGQPPPVDLREAARLDALGRCAESEVIYRRALSAGMPSPALLNNAGNHYLVCRDAVKATHYFQLLVQRVPGHVNGNLQLARIHVNRKENAVAIRRLAVLSSSSDAEVLSEAGALYARLGEFRLAQQAFQHLVAARPGDPRALFNLGRAAGRAGDYPRAIETLEAARKLEPDNASVLLELGMANAASGDYTRAVFLLAQARQKEPDRPDIALALARAAEDAGFFGDAVIAYDGYVALRPEDTAARRDRARVLANTVNRREEGFKLLEQYVAEHPRDPSGYFQLAQLCWNTDPERSLALLSEAIRHDPSLVSAHVAKAWLLHRHGRDKEALTHLESALKMAPTHVRALDQYGLVLSALDRPAEAEQAFRKAATLAPGDWEVALHLGRALIEQGREAESRPLLETYQKLRPARSRDPRREPGMIELATLPADERRAREIDRFQAMVKTRPDDMALRIHLATLLTIDGQQAAAETTFQSLLDRTPDEGTLAEMAQAAELLAKLGYSRAAADLLIRTAAAGPDNRSLQVGAAVALALNGNLDKAEARLKQLQARWPQWKRPYLAHGLLLERAARQQEADRLYELGGGQPAGECRQLEAWLARHCSEAGQ